MLGLRSEAGPVPRLECWLGQEVAVRLEDLVDVPLEALTEGWRYLVEAADQTVTEAGVRGARPWVEG